MASQIIRVDSRARAEQKRAEAADLCNAMEANLERPLTSKEITAIPKLKNAIHMYFDGIGELRSLAKERKSAPDT